MASVDVARDPPREASIESKDSEIVEAAGPGQDADLEPAEIPDATWHVFSGYIEGDYRAHVENTGRLPILNASADLDTKWKGHRIGSGSRGLGTIWTPGSRDRVRVSWRIDGAWDVLRNLVDILLSGTVRVDDTSRVEGLIFSERFNTRARIPVDDVTIRWD